MGKYIYPHAIQDIEEQAFFHRGMILKGFSLCAVRCDIYLRRRRSTLGNETITVAGVQVGR